MPYSSSGRLRAIKLPCCFALHPRLAAALCSAGGLIIYLLWTLSLSRMNASLIALAQSTNSSVNQVIVEGMRAYTGFCLYFTLSLVGVYIIALASCWFPNRDALKHISRVIWVAWCTVWLVGILGVVAFAMGDSGFAGDCVSSGGRRSPAVCAAWWQKVQIAIILAIIASLVYHFYSAVVISAYCHTLHPELFFQNTDDEEADLHYDSDESDDPAVPLSVTRYDT